MGRWQVVRKELRAGLPVPPITYFRNPSVKVRYKSLCGLPSKGGDFVFDNISQAILPCAVAHAQTHHSPFFL